MSPYTRINRRLNEEDMENSCLPIVPKMSPVFLSGLLYYLP